MELPVLLLQLLFLLPMAAISSALALAKPSCEEKCGDITIPYPFGFGDSSCYRKSYEVTCNHNFNPPKPFLLNSNIEVLNISLLGQLRTRGFLSYDCYNQLGNSTNRSRASFNLADLPYTFSDTKNKFTAMGCDTIALLTASGGRNFTGGCSMLSSDLQNLVNGSCSGIGCCQTSIPKGFKYFDVVLSSAFNHTQVSIFNPCSYAFLVDSEWFNFSVPDIMGYMDFYNINGGMVPIVLDWAIENYTCANALTSDPNYACGKNSECFNSPNGLGYLCNCSQGYQGNPYLENGCQDIDECAYPTLNDCSSSGQCTNTPGSYYCSCPDGTQGDGRKNGSGCVAPPRKRSQLIQVCLGIGFGILFLLFVSSWLYWGIQKRKLDKRKENFFQQNGGLLLRQLLSSNDANIETAKIFTEEELKKATNNFDKSLILGRGGYGTVYKGTLPNNKIVAIKKSKIVDENQVEQFINEVVILSQIEHENVVKLLACCLDSEIPLLVYEFITNGTLFHHIHDEGHKSSVSWDNRLRIATETAKALAHLHTAATPPIIHRDIKSANILLDDVFKTKVSDFGASRLVPLDHTQFTTLVQGTLGYLDPEYFQTSHLTEKSDVYSFGVVLVELLTGRKALELDRPEREKNLAIYFMGLMKEDSVLDILEDRVLNEADRDQLCEVTKLAHRCLSAKGEDRPTMKEVAMQLEELRGFDNHPWVEHNHEEVEHLLGEQPNLQNCSTSEYDSSLKGHVAISLNNGR
ncbi:PREDICTED: wall-associated receptor kinase 5-like [Nelumbo nucifera]|uniref:Wall-associated receptor kinase 2-like n=2 Tax=Nelumbo nucifera TaxID=4432 RepID=A0A822YEP2_NELNU|nr:PREDICTED: wall-associated receptor kinase 5-like [Nelumbo nucifera]DAD29425.1 TPA_asm: hypothetical protein HUJ06_030893 [Nelumbo nucifera]